MPGVSNDPSHLVECGWSTFRPELFLNEPGRKHRNVGNAFVMMLEEFCKGNKVLELCSGSGRLIIHLARNGFDVVGLDLSEEMLDISRRNIEKEHKRTRERIRLARGNMCDFELDEEFDFIVLEDDGFGYLLTQKDQISCLEAINRHLASEGLLFLSCKTPEREFVHPESFEYDPISQIKTADCHWTSENEKGKIITIREGFERRKLTYPCELEILLRFAGLQAVHRWGDLNRNPFVDPSRQEYNYLVGKASKPRNRKKLRCHER